MYINFYGHKKRPHKVYKLIFVETMSSTYNESITDQNVFRYIYTHTEIYRCKEIVEVNTIVLNIISKILKISIILTSHMFSLWLKGYL
jgi:hypothetical protein